MKSSKSSLHTQEQLSTHPLRKKRRRHTRIHLEALRPQSPCELTESLTSCPKCHGLVVVDGGVTSAEKVVRCLNCGWQPLHRLNLIQESEEARTMRALTVLFGSGCDPSRQSVNF